MKAVHERRAQPRAKLTGSAVITVGQDRLACDAVDISATGIAFIAATPVKPGEYLKINFALGGRSDRTGRLKWHEADGTVARVGRIGDRWVWGVEFVVVEERVAAEIQAFVASATGQPSPVKAHEALPGFPGGPDVAPVTGEYGPPDDREAPELRAAVGAEEASGTGAPGSAKNRAPVRPTVDDLRAVAARPQTPRVGISGRPMGIGLPKASRKRDDEDNRS